MVEEHRSTVVWLVADEFEDVAGFNVILYTNSDVNNQKDVIAVQEARYNVRGSNMITWRNHFEYLLVPLIQIVLHDL